MPPATAAGTCAIKGNISRKGDRIYQMPGPRDYERTQVDEASGERMFCSKDGAKAAGWRAPRG
ncbi:nuclease [Methylorubrum populi]|uniref:Nuclease n=1 Tax=Methylobacterium radiotolerans TaxID=31998 RepID=A0ABU7TGN7_9HYPH